ncbi:MAG: ECF transporter S component [Clostridiales bacterium]|jgi:thiamine transporter ThiT|nr:ECF transporter S component [Clostridiales bacterium]
MDNSKPRFETQKLVLLALLTALVIVLQFLGAFIKFGTFSVSLVLLPIVVGAALIGTYAGCWLGLAFGVVVLASGDANAFLGVNALGTVLTVLLKGAGAGFAAGAVYRLLAEKNKTAAVIAAAAAAPAVNTGIFFIGSCVFFMPTLTEWAENAGFPNAFTFILVVLIGGNFFFELALNLILSPVIVRLIQYGRAKAV